MVPRAGAQKVSFGNGLGDGGDAGEGGGSRGISCGLSPPTCAAAMAADLSARTWRAQRLNRAMLDLALERDGFARIRRL